MFQKDYISCCKNKWEGWGVAKTNSQNSSFAESFDFVLGLKDSLTKETTQHTHNKQFQYLIEDYLT